MQIGLQSLSDDVLDARTRAATTSPRRARAMALLRCGRLQAPRALDAEPARLARPDADLADFARLFDDPALRPDELKVYPCMLIDERAS